MILHAPAGPAARTFRSPSPALPACRTGSRAGGAGAWWRRLAAVALLLCPVLPALAIGFDDVLPVDEALALSATATSRDRIEIRWKIADGYYLYRHRTAVRVTGGGFDAGTLQLPDGRRHVDEFFGEVETWRGRLVATLPGQATADARSVALEVKYQGCADAGICYPPQTRTLQVALPDATAAAAPAADTGDGGFAALGRTLSGAAPGAAPSLAGIGSALPAEQAFAFEAIAGDGDTLLLRFTPARGYYLYRDRNSVRVEGADGIRAGRPRWPAGTAHHDEHFGAVTVYFDQVDVPLPLVRTRADAAEVTVVATFQGCQADGICYPPMTRSVRVAVPAGRVQSVAEAAVAIAGGDAGPPAAGPDPTADAMADDGDGSGDRATAAAPAAGTADAAPADVGGASAASAADDNAARTRPPATPVRGGGLFAALGLALLGGLVLNLMPCVLPILSLKVLGLAQSGGSRASARRHALWYTAGVLVAFAAIGLLVVALRAAGQALGWGFQLQQPWFVAALVYLMFAVGLSLSGVFTLGGRVGNLGQSLAARSGPAGDFFTGVLACVVASPCIAPFMGGALAFAFTASAPLALAVFLMLGLGLALPFLLIGLVPALADRLPKPGAWMETLKQLLAFPMYLTALWLAWVLGRQRGVDAMALLLAGLTVFALALWWFERRRWTGAATARGLALALVVAATVLPIVGVTRLAPAATAPATADASHVAYSAERLQALRDAGTPVFVNMTADWCVTCKANERRVLSQAPFREALAAAGAAYMVGDWTNVDPEIGAFLDAHGAVGVPLYVVYPAGGGDGVVLPPLLGDAVVVEALRAATAAP
ncbi:thioredoxin family protein [Luteimonas sp. BDR2-5]|uniref:protein-disulfide reductase DsbD family protein n=1 Tax=Proluteimonas luteida TaxID=2878685 RepID=UPI001E5931AF|nr:protein-disulfide reductase DsbD [Luteimonas sp. BDR2-5]MCD9027126.1 thioredoxin family protein [Luteimonas sp. BDR2-5]